jgi:hypothetical protein
MTSEMPEDLFQKVGDLARAAVREQVTSMMEPVAAYPDAVQAIVLGAIAGVVECFVLSSKEGVTRERLKEALRDVVSDFVDQVKDQHGVSVR